MYAMLCMTVSMMFVDMCIPDGRIVCLNNCVCVYCLFTNMGNAFELYCCLVRLYYRTFPFYHTLHQCAPAVSCQTRRVRGAQQIRKAGIKLCKNTLICSVISPIGSYHPTVDP